MSAARDRFRTVGLCWCPGTVRLEQLRAMGHTEKCTRARKAWEANHRHLSQLARERAEMEQIGRAVVAGTPSEDTDG